jgi:hypothetical protein
LFSGQILLEINVGGRNKNKSWPIFLGILQPKDVDHIKIKIKKISILIFILKMAKQMSAGPLNR